MKTCGNMYRCYSVFVRCLLVSLILLALTKDFVESLELRKPSAEFRRHNLVRPILHHARTKRQITSTKNTTGFHHPELTLTVNNGGEDYVLDLRLNDNVVAGDHVVSYQKDGKTVLYRPTREELNICQYMGTVRGREGSSVAISTCDGFSGIIFDGKKMMYIEPAEDNNLDSQHYIYEHSDLKTNFKCGYEGGVTSNRTFDPDLFEKYTTEQNVQKSRASRYKRETFEETQVRGPFNSNKLSRYVELVLVADNREFKVNGESLELIHHRFKNVANIINSVYAPLNIFIALVGIVVWSERDEIILEEDGDKTLTAFLHYRRDRLLRDIPNDNAHLLTQQKFKDGVVGKALKGPICTYNFSGGVATNHSDVIGLVATTIAHEMGHNFGMEHDTEADCKCPDEKCIMSPSSTSVTPTHWSSCSLRSLALSFERGMDYCLRNKPKRLYDSPTCGNGFLEPGEECDCGLVPLPACTSCCDHSTCTLRPNATCAVGECCDTETCRPKSAGIVCRSADKECDLPEYCTGTSEFCPKDVYKMDATPCSNNRAYCVHGSCRTHEDQCKLLWGSTGESSDKRCYYSMNVKGDKNGNCGFRREDSSTFFKCRPQNALCGLLQCKHLNERLEFGMESVSLVSATFINNNGSILPCRTVMIDLGLSDVDPGMVPDGAKCGENMMCLNTKCVSVEDVIASVAKKGTADCPSNCSGHGVCNSEGHCHCESGFAPPLCALPGPGGSYDSGPATDSSLQRNFMVAMYVIFLGILPTILVILFLTYYSRHDVLHWWKKPRKTYVNIFSRHLHKTNLTKYSPNGLFSIFIFRKDQNKTNEHQEENIYENVDNDYESIKSVKIEKTNVWTRIVSMFESKPVDTKIKRKINKCDIIVAGNTEFVKTTPIKKNDIIKTGLTSTTNQNISKDLTVNFNGAVHVKSKLSKDNIVNAGLASTTNQKLNNLNAERLKTKDIRDVESIPRVHVNDITKRFELRKLNVSHK